MREPISSHHAVDMLRESTLPHVERAVLTEIAWHWPNMWPSINRIVRHTGLGYRTVIDALERLEKEYVIEVISAKTTDTLRLNFANRYSIRWEKLQEAAPEDRRSITSRLRQELAEAQQILWNDSQPDHGRETDGPTAGEAVGAADLVREAQYLPTAGAVVGATGDDPDLLRLAQRPTAGAAPDLLREPHPNKVLNKELEEEPYAAKKTSQPAARRTKKKKASKLKPPPDPRHKPFWEDWETYFKTKNKCPAPEDEQEHWHLGRFLKKNLGMKREEWRTILNNRGHSPVTHARSLSQWISFALSWLNGLADDWGKPISENSNSRKPPASQKISGIDYEREFNFQSGQAVGKL